VRSGRYVKVATQAEGLHHWPAAPAQEGYLNQPHRHLFTITIRLQVRHDDREVEINAFTRWLHDQVLPSLAAVSHDGGPADFGTRSCEQLAEQITARIRMRHGEDRWIECEVLEDGILGGGSRWPG
jgi:hypothetical protein